MGQPAGVDMIEVLVTAVGGDVGQAVVKALRLSSTPMTIHGCDMDGSGVGAAFVDAFYTLPAASEPTYVEDLTALCRVTGARVVIPTSEQEIRELCSLGKLENGTCVVCQRAAVVFPFSDKLYTMSRLEGIVDLAPYADGEYSKCVADLVECTDFPLVVKARRSCGSKSLSIVTTKRELAEALRQTEKPLVQAYIPDTAGEYSVGVYWGRDFHDAIAFRRTLAGHGCSWEAVVDQDADVLSYARWIAAVVEPRGSINIQVRKNAQGVHLLEVNPRFSSLAAARAVAGFKDVEWSVVEALDLPISPPMTYTPLRFRRYYGELIDCGDGYQAIPQWRLE